MNFLAMLKKRRSIYMLKKEGSLTEAQVVEKIEECIKYTPSAFNMPTSKVVVLLGAEHEKLWKITEEELAKQLAELRPEAYQLVSAKMKDIKNAMGTILFYEDNGLVEELKDSYAMYTDSFSSWSKEHLGMLQSNIWLALSEAGMGVNLQHYNQVIAKTITAEFKLPKEWELVGQMVFGGIMVEPEEKELDDIQDRILIFK